jgi:hypothetical protein
MLFMQCVFATLVAQMPLTNFASHYCYRYDECHFCTYGSVTVSVLSSNVAVYVRCFCQSVMARNT